MKHKSSKNGSKIGRALLLPFLLLVMVPLSANAQGMEPPRFKRALTFLDKPGYLAFSEDLLKRLSHSIFL